MISVPSLLAAIRDVVTLSWVRDLPPWCFGLNRWSLHMAPVADSSILRIERAVSRLKGEAGLQPILDPSVSQLP